LFVEKDKFKILQYYCYCC